MFAHELPTYDPTPRNCEAIARRSAISLATAIIALPDVHDSGGCTLPHKKTLLARIYSFVTDAGGKYSRPYRSQGVIDAMSEGRNDMVVEHDHVFSRAWITGQLIADPRKIERIFNNHLIACLVTRPEHALLGEAERVHGKNGWDRYRHAGVMVPGAPLDE